MKDKQISPKNKEKRGKKTYLLLERKTKRTIDTNNKNKNNKSTITILY